MPEISVVIIHWNTPALLEKQLKLLSSPKKNIEIIVVDNFSTGGVRETVSKRTKNADRVIMNNENLGFARAANIGLKLAKGEWILFLNPDVMITHDSVRSFVSKAKEISLDAASPSTTDDRYLKPLPTPLSLLAEFSPVHRIVSLNRFKQKTLTGGCLLIRKEVLERLGGWDEDFFLWFEDSDLTKRLLDGGYRIGWINTDLTHQGGASFEHLHDKDRKKFFFTSMKVYAQKHFSYFGNQVVKLLSVRFS